MSAYLDPQWFDHAIKAVATTPVDSTHTDPVVFSYRITDVPDGHPAAGRDVCYQIAIDPGPGSASLAEAGAGEEGDVRFTLAYSVAHAIATGERSGSRAFLDGEIRVGGDISLLIDRARELSALDRVLTADPPSDVGDA